VEGCPTTARTTEPARYVATTGMPLTEQGENRPGDLSLAARNALLAMIDELQERGFSKQQAYALCSVAVDLKVSQGVDVPNVLLSAFLPLALFRETGRAGRDSQPSGGRIRGAVAGW